MKGNYRHLIHGSAIAQAWRIVDLQTEIWAWNLSNKKHECLPLGSDVGCLEVTVSIIRETTLIIEQKKRNLWNVGKRLTTRRKYRDDNYMRSWLCSNLFGSD